MLFSWSSLNKYYFNAFIPQTLSAVNFSRIFMQLKKGLFFYRLDVFFPLYYKFITCIGNQKFDTNVGGWMCGEKMKIETLNEFQMMTPRNLHHAR